MKQFVSDKTALYVFNHASFSDSVYINPESAGFAWLKTVSVFLYRFELSFSGVIPTATDVDRSRSTNQIVEL